MDTKWKSIIKMILPFYKNHKKVAAAGFAGILTAAGLILLFRVAYRLTTPMVWSAGVILNIMCAFCLTVCFSFFLRKKYENWNAQDESFFAQWKATGKKIQRQIASIAIPALVLSFLFFLYIISKRSYYYYYNYAMPYFLIFSVLIQYGIAQLCLFSFMQEKLNGLMECMSSVNRKNLEAAIEIERKSIEKAAKSEQLKIDLISNVSHDLKTPLTSMVGYIELVKKEDLNPVVRDYVGVISDKAEKLKEMIESLFSLAKASSGNIQIETEAVDLNMLIEQIFADMADQIENSSLRFIPVLTEEDTHLMTDHLHLYRICQNLIENALKYSAAGTRVFTKTFIEKTEGSQEEMVGLEITNTAGYFMDFEKEDILERFARGDKARTSEGNGLGLAIVSTYAGALGGTFDIFIDCDQFKARLLFPRQFRG